MNILTERENVLHPVKKNIVLWKYVIKNEKGLSYTKHLITTFQTPLKGLEDKIPENRIKWLKWKIGKKNDKNIVASIWDIL